jgi:HK97 family phage major capsid protein
MDPKLMQLKAERQECINGMKDILDLCDEQHRDMNDAEKRHYREYDAKIDVIEGKIKAREKVSDLETRTAGERQVMNPFPGNARPGGDRSTEGDTGGFRNIGEFLFTLAALRRDGRQDERLNRAYEINESRIQVMGAGSAGGFAIPEQWDNQLRMVEPQEAICRPRATVIAAGSPADATLSVPVLDQTSSQNIYGGIQITHTGEAVPMIETSAKLREVNLQPGEISAFVTCSNKLLMNWEASGPLIFGLLRRAVNGTEDYDFLRGDGLNKAIGALNCGAAISYNRAGAGGIAYSDIYGMLARVLMRGSSLVWAASQTVIPQLAAMTDSGGHSVWTGGAPLAGVAAPMPSTLFGIPLMWSERLPALGTKGDLNLLSLEHYLIKDGSGPIAASSDQIFFTSNLTVFKIVWNVDGKPWLSAPIQLEGNTATVSPFVVLN